MGQRSRSDWRSKSQTGAEDNPTPLSPFLVDERFGTERKDLPLSRWKLAGGQTAARAAGRPALVRPAAGSGAQPQAYSHRYGNAAGCRGPLRRSAVLFKRRRRTAPTAQALAFALFLGSPTV